MNQCQRCLKMTDGIHACNPSEYARKVETQRDAARIRIDELERLVEAQRKRFDIEGNRITFADHKVFHKALIRDAIKNMKGCKGRPYLAWDTWLIDATCMLERVLREWPAPQEVVLPTRKPEVES